MSEAQRTGIQRIDRMYQISERYRIITIILIIIALVGIISPIPMIERRIS